MITGKYKAAIFDMDGTILDTIQDMKDSFCTVLKENGYPYDYTVEQVKYFFGSGIQMAIVRAMAASKGMELTQTLNLKTVPPEIMEEVRQLARKWSDYYARHCTNHTRPFAGMLTVLEHLQEKTIQTAVVSNKPDPAVQILAENYFHGKFAYIIGEQEKIRRKPYPDMLLETLKQMQISPSECVYIGDSEIDIETARNTGCDVIAVTWGFRNEDYLRSQQPDQIAQTMDELENMILHS